MDTPLGRVARQQPVERFKPTTGTYVGWSGLLLAFGAVVYVAVAEHSVLGLRIGLAALFAAVVIWATQLRPRVTAYPDTLLMQGSVRDSYVPLAAIDEVAMGQTLNVYAGGKRYVCVGIGRSLGADVRQRVRAQGGGQSIFGTRAYQYTGKPEVAGKERSTTYHVFVLERITDMVAAARAADGAEHPVVHRFAVAEIAALVVTGAAFVASLLL